VNWHSTGGMPGFCALINYTKLHADPQPNPLVRRHVTDSSLLHTMPVRHVCVLHEVRHQDALWATCHVIQCITQAPVQSQAAFNQLTVYVGGVLLLCRAALMLSRHKRHRALTTLVSCMLDKPLSFQLGRRKLAQHHSCAASFGWAPCQIARTKHAGLDNARHQIRVCIYSAPCVHVHAGHVGSATGDAVSRSMPMRVLRVLFAMFAMFFAIVWTLSFDEDWNAGASAG
jgi:hypothetical protein